MKRDLKKERKDLDKSKLKLIKNIEETENVSLLIHTLKSNPVLDESILSIMLAVTPKAKEEVLFRLKQLCKLSLEINDLIIDYGEKKIEEIEKEDK